MTRTRTALVQRQEDLELAPRRDEEGRCLPHNRHGDIPRLPKGLRAREKRVPTFTARADGVWKVVQGTDGLSYCRPLTTGERAAEDVRREKAGQAAREEAERAEAEREYQEVQKRAKYERINALRRSKGLPPMAAPPALRPLSSEEQAALAGWGDLG